MISYLYVLLVRGTPLIVQIFFMYFGANLLLGFDLFPRAVDLGVISIDGAVVAGTVALADQRRRLHERDHPRRHRRGRPRGRWRRRSRSA